MKEIKQNLKNHFLLAMPHMADPNFAHTLTYICEHNDQGAMGITVNRPNDIAMDEVFDQLELPILDDEMGAAPVYRGGPVAHERGFILHLGDGDWQSSMQVADNIFLTTSQDILGAIASGDGPSHYLFALGYSGWGADQLEEEIAANAWLTVPVSKRILFELPADKRLDAAASSIGIDLNLLSAEAGHA